MSADVNCPSCDQHIGVEFRAEDIPFLYGVKGPKQVQLVAHNVSVGNCRMCGFTWTGVEAELAKSDATVKHLQEKVVELEARLGN